MRTQTSLRSTVIIIVLLSGILITALSAFLFTRLDQVVHGDLYYYGLQFDPEWAIKYWTNARLMLSLLLVAMTVNGVAVAFVLFGARKGKTESAKLVSCLLLTVGIAMIGLSAFFFNQLDSVVHGDLYRYGLQFNTEWADKYWTYARLIIGLLGLAATMPAVSIFMLLKGAQEGEIHPFKARPPLRIKSTQIISFLLLPAGIVALALSMNYASSVLALIGLGLVFWAAILLYIRPERYIKQTLLDKTTLPTLEILDKILGELGYKSRGIYLPPKYLKEFESNKVYIGAEEKGQLPLLEKIQILQDQILVKNPDGILITPPGAELTRLFEESLGTTFTRVDLQYFEQNIPKLLIEDLEIAQNIEIETKDTTVHVKIENSVYKNICKETRKLPNIIGSLGCPLCSALACALAKATGKPVIIEKEQTSEDGLTINIEYRLLEENPQ